MTDKNNEMTCEKHGQAISAVVCGHLVKNNGVPLGFIENSSDPDDLQGWCYACEHVYLQENDRTDKFKSFSKTAVVCTACYEEIKSKHNIKT